LLAALALFLVYQATAYLLAAKPTFAPVADPGTATLAHNKGLLPIDFQIVLNRNVSAGAYSVTTDAPRLIANRNLDERQILEI
jgi:hypothetical protein